MLSAQIILFLLAVLFFTLAGFGVLANRGIRFELLGVAALVLALWVIK